MLIAEKVAAGLEEAFVRFRDALETLDPETVDAAEAALGIQAAVTAATLERMGYADHAVTQELRSDLYVRKSDLASAGLLVRDVRGLLRAATGR